MCVDVFLFTDTIPHTHLRFVLYTHTLTIAKEWERESEHSIFQHLLPALYFGIGAYTGPYDIGILHTKITEH